MVDKSTGFKIHISIYSHYDFKTFSIHCQIKWEGYITFDSDINNLKADIGNIISIYCLVAALDSFLETSIRRLKTGFVRG